LVACILSVIILFDMEAQHANTSAYFELSGVERLILGRRLSGIILTKGPEAALTILHESRQPCYDASQGDRLNDIVGIVTAIPYGVRVAIVESVI